MNGKHNEFQKTGDDGGNSCKDNEDDASETKEEKETACLSLRIIELESQLDDA